MKTIAVAMIVTSIRIPALLRDRARAEGRKNGIPSLNALVTYLLQRYISVE